MKSSENISERKIELAHWLLEINDEAIIAQIEELKEAVLADWYESLTEEEKAEVEASEADVAAGRVVSQEELFKEAMAWLRK